MAAAAETDTQAENVANTSGITPDSLKQTLKEKLQANHVDINDMSGESLHNFCLIFFTSDMLCK